jgi:hypothetical protein
MFDTDELSNHKAEADQQEATDKGNHAGCDDGRIEGVVLNRYPGADESNSRRRYNRPKDQQ